jgi:hypothetical protein
MSNHIQQYGFTKSYINNNSNITQNELNWSSDYDGNIANIHVNIDDNGEKKQMYMQLDNNDLLDILKIQSDQIPLDRRLSRDFLGNAVALDGIIYNNKKRKSRNQLRQKKHKKSRKIR